MNKDDQSMIKRIGLLVVAAIVAVIVVIGAFSSLYEVDADEVVVLQNPSGRLEVWDTAGWQISLFGKVTRYQKSQQFNYMYEKAEGTVEDENKMITKDCIQTRFNDKGSATICGSFTFDLPSDHKQMLELHQKFHSMDGIRTRLVRPAIVRSIYNSGPFMSSKESAGQRRSELDRLVQEQAIHGVYETSTRESEVPDILAPTIKVVEVVEVADRDAEGKPKLDAKGNAILIKVAQEVEKTATAKILVVEPKVDKKGMPMIQERSTATALGLRLYNFTIERIFYETSVKEQIDKQRNMEMAVQTKISEAKQAQQDVITAEQKGKAEAARARWDQEVLKARAITEAEQKVEVATKDLETARLERQAAVERAKGEAEAKKLVMEADGALEKKLKAYVEVQKAYAAEIGKQRWVPDVQVGSSGSANPATDLMQLLQIKAAKDLALDMKVK